MSHQQKAMLVAGLILLCGTHEAVAERSFAKSLRLKGQSRGQVTLEVAGNGRNNGTDLEPKMEVLNKTEIQKETSSECLCELGAFWHWRIHRCVPQGAWGYECGFFPAEHHHRVCRDKLKCQKTADAPDTYTSHGLYEGTANTFPASCAPCSKTDECEVGQKRHSEECLMKLTLSGEACQTVRVTVPAEATAKATESHTAAVNDTTKTASATHEATSTVNVTAESTACVTIEEVKKALNLEDTKDVGEVLASRIVDKGNEMAFERAMLGALEEATRKGLLKAQEAATAIAESRAAAEARMKAERLAHEAAAWAAEAGANAKAQEAAAKRAAALEAERQKASAEAEAHQEVSDEAAAQAAANIAEVAAGTARRTQSNQTEREPYPEPKQNRFRKITDKEVAKELP